MATHYASSPGDEWTATNLFSVVWNSPCVDFLDRLFLGTNHGRRPASPPTHTWLIESKVFWCLSRLVMIERTGGRDSLSHCHYPVILAYYYHPLMVKCIIVSYFLVTIYIYIYIYKNNCVLIRYTQQERLSIWTVVSIKDMLNKQVYPYIYIYTHTGF